MLVLFWIILRFAFIAGIIFLAIHNIRNLSFEKYFQSLRKIFSKISSPSNAIKTQQTLSVELYIWVPPENHYCCEDCLDRSTWNPMDIADWMQKGLPRTTEAQTQCQDNCTCQLMLIHPRKAARE